MSNSIASTIDDGDIYFDQLDSTIVVSSDAQGSSSHRHQRLSWIPSIPFRRQWGNSNARTLFPTPNTNKAVPSFDLTLPDDISLESGDPPVDSSCPVTMESKDEQHGTTLAIQRFHPENHHAALYQQEDDDDSTMTDMALDILGISTTLYSNNKNKNDEDDDDDNEESSKRNQNTNNQDAPKSSRYWKWAIGVLGIVTIAAAIVAVIGAAVLARQEDTTRPTTLDNSNETPWAWTTNSTTLWNQTTTKDSKTSAPHDNVLVPTVAPKVQQEEKQQEEEFVFDKEEQNAIDEEKEGIIDEAQQEEDIAPEEQQEEADEGEPQEDLFDEEQKDFADEEDEVVVEEEGNQQEGSVQEEQQEDTEVLHNEQAEEGQGEQGGSVDEAPEDREEDGLPPATSDVSEENNTTAVEESCRDDLTIEIYINNEFGYRTCDWLWSKPGHRSRLCERGQEAWEHCPRTCEQCYPQECMDTPIYVDINNVHEYQPCDWLDTNPGHRSRLCEFGKQGWRYCPKTCGRCDP